MAEGKDVVLSFGNLAEWTEKSFKGHTTYSVVKSNGKDVLHAQTNGNASGLYRKIALPTRELPVIRWSWKVAQTLAAEDAYRKSGDDFAARVYIVFPGRFFWQTRALVYVYSDKLPVGAVIPNPFTKRAAVIAVESGNQHAGIWRHETRRYVDDYRNYFHGDPPYTVAVAIMTDGDNTGSAAEAWYGDIVFSAE
ncbi:MAG: DUF3047 domain-containing protein [Geobacteraceae bacterium]|nr:DUF3047 domain-containing protein [Geobacteraceae bacterium]